MAPPAKRRKVEPSIEEITFDTAARQDFLTGFHKRKVQRAKHAQEKAEQRARQDRIEERKKLREERKAELERHVEAVSEMLNPVGLQTEESSDSSDGENGVESEWNGINDVDIQPIDHEAEYIDEDKYTTVTIETVNITRDGLRKADDEHGRPGMHDTDEDDGDPDDRKHNLSANKSTSTSNKSKSTKRPWTAERPSDARKKPKKKRNFRYEGKLERKAGRAKEKLKNRQQAKARRAA